MPWISPRTSEWKLTTRCLRDVWWFRKELKKLKKKEASEINTNANLWKWLYLWFDGLYKYRIQQSRYIRNPFGPVGPPSLISIGGRRNQNHFNKWVEEVSTRILGYRCIPLHSGNQVMLHRHTKAARMGGDVLAYVTIENWNNYIENDDIKWCSYRNDWFFASCFVHIRDYRGGSDYVTISIANPNIFQCPSCGYHYHDTPNNKVRNKFTMLVTCPQCKNNKPSNPPHTTATIFGDYHSHYRSGWKFFPCYIPGDETVPLGVELEMQSKAKTSDFIPRDIAWQMYQHQLANNPKWNLFYCERDGSIGEHGMEMITQPMTQQLHNQFWTHMLPFIRQHFVGWNTQKRHPGGQYGIHITFDSQLYGQLNMARLAKFLDNTNNQAFVQGIAQRGALYGASEHIAASTKRVSQVFKYEKGKMLGSQSRNQPLNLKSPGGLCEVRMFRSTLNTTSFFKNLEFLWAFRQWCGETPWNVSYLTFLSWLASNPKLYSRYPHLYEYMCHKTFPVDNARWDVVNRSSGVFIELVEKLKKGQKDLFESFSPENSDYVS